MHVDAGVGGHCPLDKVEVGVDKVQERVDKVELWVDKG